MKSRKYFTNPSPRYCVPSWKGVLFVLIPCLMMVPGCSTLENGKRWGEDVTLRPGWNKASDSAYEIITSPMFYVPAAAALLLQIDNADERLSDWAMKHTPVYGSQERADELSKDFRGYTADVFYLSILATPSGDDPLPWGIAKAKGALVQQSAVGLNHLTVKSMKEVTRRERPCGNNEKSFPSSRSSSMTVFTMLSSKNIDAMNIPNSAKITSKVILSGLLVAGSWGRIESGSHYPGDVLAGISVGYFVSSFIHESFMGLGSRQSGGVVVTSGPEGIFIGYQSRF
jgi:hypothetical protein